MKPVWKIAPGDNAEDWPVFRKKGCIGLGWTKIKNFLVFQTEEDVLSTLKQLYQGEKGSGSGAAGTIWRFTREVQPGHIVVANDGRSRVVGIGVVKSDYLPPGSPDNPITDSDDARPHVRRVEWVIDQDVSLSETHFFGIATLTSLADEKVQQIRQVYEQKYPHLKEKLAQLFSDAPVPIPSHPPSNSMNSLLEIRALLEQFRQVIVYGPPGTGKTREAMRTALTVLSGKEPAAEAAPRFIEKELKPFRNSNRFDLVVFHPAYEYEQFVGGIEPTLVNSQIAFKTRGGTFLRLCRAAELHTLPTVIIIDEINRGNLPKLLGELVYALEYRDQEVRLPFEWEGRADLIVPTNLLVIATMNSSDRSIGHIDVAIRRRFGLCQLGPNEEVIRREWSRPGRDTAYGNQLAKMMNRINSKLGTGDNPTAEAELGVGHSYFIPSPEASGDAAKDQVRRKWQYQVQPLLREYAQLLNQADYFQAFLKQFLDQALAEL